jgi:hypothetical protein
LRKLGYEEKQKWPFNTKTMGYTSISRYIDKVILHPQIAVKSLASPEVEKIKSK